MTGWAWYPGSGLYVDYDYLVTGEIGFIRENGATTGVGVLGAYSYDDRGRRTSLTRGNGTSAAYSYDDADRLTQQVESLSGTNYDQTLGFSYNPAGQIAGTTRSNDAYAWTNHYAVNRAYTANGLNQYSGVGGLTYGYDLNGNLISDGSRTYLYDVENRMVAGVGATLSYDPLGRLFQVTASGGGITRFLCDGDALVAEYDGAGEMTRRYVHWDGADVPIMAYANAALTGPSYLHADHQGSIVAVSGPVGIPVTINSYDEYGIPGVNNAGRFQYTGQVWLPELGLYYYKARIYSPTLGRFMQTDPIGYDDQFNLYGYVGNDPLNNTDPSGQQTGCTGSRIDCGGGLAPGRSGSSSGESGTRRNLLMPLPHGDCDTRAQCDFARDEAAALRGDMSPATLVDRMRWRGIGGIIGAAPYAAPYMLEAMGLARMRAIVQGIARWLGPRYTSTTLPSGNRVFQSADGLRRFRIDFTQARGTFRGAHAQFETRAFIRRPFQPVPDIPRHIYFVP